LPLITTVPLPGLTCSDGGASLPLTKAIPLSGVVCGADDAWLPLITAGTLLGTVCRADGACLPRTTSESVFGEDGPAGSARELLSAAVLLTGGSCGGAGVTLSAAMLLTGADGGADCSPVPPTTGEPAVIGAVVGAESASSHAHKAAAQIPAVASRLAAMPALRSLADRLGGTALRLSRDVRFRCRGVRVHCITPHRRCTGVEVLFSDICEYVQELGTNGIPDLARDANACRLSKPRKARGHVEVIPRATRPGASLRESDPVARGCRRGG
jgi:hypothetical protein